MANKRQMYYVKYGEDNPTMRSIRKYEQEIAELEKKRAEANANHDWSMRNWYSNQITAKQKNMELLKESYGAQRLQKLAVSDDW